MLALLLALAGDVPVPQCFTVSEAVAEAEASGGKLINLIDVPGEHVDQMLFAVVNGTIAMWGVKQGCMVGPVVPLDDVKDKGTPA